MKEKAFAFTSGAGTGLFVGIRQLMAQLPVVDFWLEMSKALIIGVAGGIGGLIAKEIYHYIKKKYGNKVRH